MSHDDDAPPQPVEEEDFAALFAASLDPAVFEIGQLLQGALVRGDDRPSGFWPS